MIKNSWAVLKETVLSFIEDEALTRGAAMALYAVTSLARLSAFQAARHRVSTNRFSKCAGISTGARLIPGHGKILRRP